MSSRKLGPCLVCGDAAIGINFAVPTCAPCKAFFRRNAVKLGKIDFFCPGDGDCRVTVTTRHKCNCCRLAKCFRVGMQKSLILTNAEREARKEIVQQSRQKLMQSAIIQKSNLIRRASIHHLTQEKSKMLSLSDQTLLTNIFGAYEQNYPATDTCKYSNFPTVEHLTIHTYYNEYEERHKLLIDYFKSIPEFNRLSVDDKISLVRSHFGGMLIINEDILTRSVCQNVIVSLKNMYSTNLATKLIRIGERLLAYANDPVQLKLILIIQTLSSGNYRYYNNTDEDRIYDDTLAIFAGQNVYVALLWRYLLSRLPSERDAVKFFNNLILDLIFLECTCFAVERYMYNLDDEIDKMKPLMQNLWRMSDKKSDMGDDDSIE